VASLNQAILSRWRCWLGGRHAKIMIMIMIMIMIKIKIKIKKRDTEGEDGWWGL
jgi:hypothetical protein